MFLFKLALGKSGQKAGRCPGGGRLGTTCGLWTREPSERTRELGEGREKTGKDTNKNVWSIQDLSSQSYVPEASWTAVLGPTMADAWFPRSVIFGRCLMHVCGSNSFHSV